MHYKTIDLFSGIGGIRKGFEMTGQFTNILSAEIDKYACKTYKHLYGDDPTNDLTSEDFKALLGNIDYDVLLAGFPCQSFSSQGHMLGFEDEERGIIFAHIAEIIKRTSPKAVFLENVENLVRHDKGNTFRIILDTLENELDYKIIGVKRNDDGSLQYQGKDFVRNSRFFGVPQNRPRTYIMGFNRKYYSNADDELQNSLPTGNDLQIYNDLNDLLEYGADAKYYLASGYLDTLVKHRERNKKNGNGFGYRIVNDPSIEHPIANTILAIGGSGKERNLVYDPQEDIPGKIVSPKSTPLNADCIRFMTPKEWGKLQGFIGYAFLGEGDDGFSFPNGISDFQQYKQFGNSVTIPVIKTMAEFMLECFQRMK